MWSGPVIPGLLLLLTALPGKYCHRRRTGRGHWGHDYSTFRLTFFFAKKSIAFKHKLLHGKLFTMTREARIYIGTTISWRSWILLKMRLKFHWPSHFSRHPYALDDCTDCSSVVFRGAPKGRARGPGPSPWDLKKTRGYQCFFR